MKRLKWILYIIISIIIGGIYSIFQCDPAKAADATYDTTGYVVLDWTHIDDQGQL